MRAKFFVSTTRLFVDMVRAYTDDGRKAAGRGCWSRFKEDGLSTRQIALDMFVVGLGQGGGNIAGEFHRRGYRAMALNTAQADLRSLGGNDNNPSVPEEDRIHIGIEGYDGAGCDPNFGRSCVQAHSDRIRQAVIERSLGADMIVLTAGLGGGTGSSLGALIEVLADVPLPLLALVTIPMRGENAIVKVNAVRAINQLASAPLRSLMIVDNARADELVRDAPMADYYRRINAAIVEPLDSLNRLNSRSELKSLRSFDGEEFRKLLLAGGVLNYGHVRLNAFSEQELNEATHHCLRAGELMPPGFEPNNVAYLAAIITASAQTLARVPMSVIDNFHQSWKAATQGAAVEVGIYCSSAEETPTHLWVLALSPALPLELQELVLEASREATTARDKLRQHVGGIDVSGLEGLEVLPSFERNTAPKPRSVSFAPAGNPSMDRSGPTDPRSQGRGGGPGAAFADMQGSLDTERQSPSQRAAARPRNTVSDGSASSGPTASSAPGSHAGDQGNDRRSAMGAQAAPRARKTNGHDGRARGVATASDLRAMDASAPSSGRISYPDVELALEESSEGNHNFLGEPLPPPVPLGIDGLPGPEVYERLVRTYRDSTSDTTRHQIAERLENDRFSEHAVVRYYVVQAMARIGKPLFESALIAATEDDNESVRMLASRAVGS